jgi:hypothetical protein
MKGHFGMKANEGLSNQTGGEGNTSISSKLLNMKVLRLWNNFLVYVTHG